MRYSPKHYARAIRAAFVTVTEARAIADELIAMSDALAAHELAREFLASRAIPLSDRKIALERMVGKPFRAETVRTIILLMRNGQLRELPAIVRAVARVLDAEERIARVLVESAHAIPAPARKRIEDAIATHTGKRAVATYADSPDILGGFRVTVDGATRWDGTTLGRISALAAHLHSNDRVVRSFLSRQ